MNQRLRHQWHVWDGIYTVDFTLEAVHRRCLSLRALLRERGWSCLVAHDTRFLSHQMARYVVQMLEHDGIPFSFSQVPTVVPAVELALDQRHTECAIMVTAGNRAHWHNGLMVSVPGVEAALLAPTTDPWQQNPFPVGETGERLPASDLRTPYLNYLRSILDMEAIRRSTFTLFVDPMYGSASGLIPTILGEGSQTKAIEINREYDPLFGRQPPQPNETSLLRLRKLVRESDSHVGLGISADGRALMVTDNLGELLNPSEVALLIAMHLARQHRLRGTVVLPTITQTAGLRQIEQNTGLKIEAVAEPQQRIHELMQQDRHQLLIGATTLGEFTIGRWGTGADGIMAALALLEMLSRATNVKLRTLVDELRGNLGALLAS